jgi:hypothetical protein
MFSLDKKTSAIPPHDRFSKPEQRTENAGKETVRRFFVPYPDVHSFEELNQYLHNECLKLLDKNLKWEAEKAALRPLPTVRFDGARYKEAKVNRYSMIQFEMNRYE